MYNKMLIKNVTRLLKDIEDNPEEDGYDIIRRFVTKYERKKTVEFQKFTKFIISFNIFYFCFFYSFIN